MRREDGDGCPCVCTFLVRETSGLGKSMRHVGDDTNDSTEKHLLQRGMDFRSYDSESTRIDENSGAPGVPGVAGADTFGVTFSDSGIFSIIKKVKKKNPKFLVLNAEREKKNTT